MTPVEKSPVDATGGQRDLGAAREQAVELAAAAGRLQLQRRSTVVVHATKAHANDLVSDVDHASERLIVDGLRARWPTDGLLGEEGASASGESGWRWVIDPLDGTRNYLSASGPWSVCIALQRDDVTEMAVVHEPAADETFSAIRGGGSVRNAERLRASDCARLDEAIIGLSFNPSPATKARLGGLLPVLLPAVGDIRRMPSALCLCYLAAGRLDGGLCLDTKLWDVAAALLIAEEAGVVLGGIGGRPTPELVIAAAPAVEPELRTVLGGLLPQLGAGSGGSETAAGPLV